LQIALNDNNKRIHPSYSGQRAICPNCGGTLIAKCGTIYIQHWQHWKERDCDPWQENETIWHRGWKARFPFEWQEVVIEKSGERHRADVRTDMNVVIEFQNSPISTSDIRIREEFYGDMVG
jgi:competence CoiA-like predicted nuclease